jgi:E3 ubiquitin-protein ligase CHFR
LRDQAKIRQSTTSHGFGGGGFDFGGFQFGTRVDGDSDVESFSDEEDAYIEEEEEYDETTCQECVRQGPDGFQCPRENAHHFSCAGCARLMPARLSTDRPQQCKICDDYFCQQYFNTPCSNREGEFKKLKDFQFSVLPQDCLNENQIEKEILLNYMAKKSYSTNRLFQQICSAVEDGTLSTTDFTDKDLSTSDYICKFCATQFFSSLIYDFRLNIPEIDLPKDVQKKPICWYGRECNTQKHNMMHAKNYNHIGENKKKK